MTPLARTLLAGLPPRARASALALAILAALALLGASPGRPLLAAEGARAAAQAETPAAPAASEKEESCVTCHKTLGEISDKLYAPAKAWADDVHHSRGLGCAGCHGGDPSSTVAQDSDKAMDPKKGFVAKPARKGVAEFCGRCHSDATFMKRFNPAARVDQVAEYRTSIHGIKNAAGDEKTATCIDCHGMHGVQPVSSPKSPAYPTNVPGTCGRCHADAALMAAYGKKDNPLEDWKKSVHAEAILVKGDLSAPVCNDCHGNHGAVPPGVSSLANVCGQCHGREAMFFGQSFKKKLFDETGASECVTCHSNHEIHKPSDKLIGTGPGTVCSQCHEPGDKCDKASVEIRRALDAYSRSLDETREILDRAEQAGMEVSRSVFTLKKEGVSGLVETRALIHTFDPKKLVKRAEDGMAVVAKVRGEGETALAEVQYRRKGLAVSLAFVGLVLVGLYLKIKDVDRRQSR